LATPHSKRRDADALFPSSFEEGWPEGPGWCLFPSSFKEGWPEGPGWCLFPSFIKEGVARRAGVVSFPLLIEEGWPEGPGWLYAMRGNSKPDSHLRHDLNGTQLGSDGSAGADHLLQVLVERAYLRTLGNRAL